MLKNKNYFANIATLANKNYAIPLHTMSCMRRCFVQKLITIQNQFKAKETGQLLRVISTFSVVYF